MGIVHYLKYSSFSNNIINIIIAIHIACFKAISNFYHIRENTHTGILLLVTPSCHTQPIALDLTRLPSQTTSSRWQEDKEAIGLSRVQKLSHLCVACPYQISVNSIFKHIHTTSINTIIWQFVPFIYHPL